MPPPGKRDPFGEATAAFRKLRAAWEQLQKSYLAKDGDFHKARAEWAAALAELSDAIGDVRQIHDTTLKRLARAADQLRRTKSRSASSLSASARRRRKRAPVRKAP